MVIDCDRFFFLVSVRHNEGQSQSGTAVFQGGQYLLYWQRTLRISPELTTTDFLMELFSLIRQ